MLKRSSSSSLRLWTRTQRGGAFFVSDKTEIVFFESSFFFRGRERAKERKSASETTTTMDAPDYTREREMIRLNPTTTTQKSLSPSFSLRVVSLKTHKTIHTTGPTHAHTKKNRTRDDWWFWCSSSLSSFSRVVSSGVKVEQQHVKRLPKTRLRDYTEQILFFFFFFFFFFLARKKKLKTPL